MAESEWSGRVRMAVRMSWPNHPGRVNFGRVNLAESECHGQMNCRIRVVWPNELVLGRVTFDRVSIIRVIFDRVTLCRVCFDRMRFGWITLAESRNTSAE